MAWKWFSAKTVYRTTTPGRARRVDAMYIPDHTLVEERVIVLKARSFDEALRRAETEARTYARRLKGRRNRYGQQIITRYLGDIEVFEMFDPPRSMIEVYSSMYTISGNIPDRTISDNHFGPRAALIERDQFLEREVSELLRLRAKEDA